MPALIEIRLRNEAGEITCVNALARAAHLASSGSSIPAGCVELALRKKNQGIIWACELCLDRLTHLLGAGQAGDIAITTGNYQPAAVSTAIGSLSELLWHIIILNA